MDLWNTAIALSLGLGLSAACGFRVFIPLLVMGIGARAGLIELGESWTWMSETWVIAAFATATLFEIGGYYIPWIDNLLDTITTPSAIVAGIMNGGKIVRVHDVKQIKRAVMIIEKILA